MRWNMGAKRWNTREKAWNMRAKRYGPEVGIFVVTLKEVGNEFPEVLSKHYSPLKFEYYAIHSKSRPEHNY